ncbi:hypothetical protein LSH36_35g06053 [Paralvinella palmiformis]|uniref:Complex 1 LYR protein domain-containing protein n=1 Tax=Paralvinella palmiformis TaxID=53620 RepID=A0AAD9NEA0_9ANNE|nr:hypothetical protein LSH36_35g06053 [Paralvinella palmiformis]
MTSRTKALSLYKALLRESRKFSNYNFRTYALRRVKDAFRENKVVTDQSKIGELLIFGEESLKIIQRQVTVGQLYGDLPVVLEKKIEQTS